VFEGLNLVSVENAADVENLVKRGNKNRSVGSHNFNEHSSRSHLVVTVQITRQHEVDGNMRTRISSLNLIDLAGSERISKTDASGERLKEAQSINKSLSALGDVIGSLGGSSKHVPYRNSKLTWLLSSSLSGNSKVLMFVCVSPSRMCVSETMCSLNFAQRCHATELGKAKKVGERSSSSGLKRGSGRR
jgi:kinesin family protein C2/C3